MKFVKINYYYLLHVGFLSFLRKARLCGYQQKPGCTYRNTASKSISAMQRYRMHSTDFEALLRYLPSYNALDAVHY